MLPPFQNMHLATSLSTRANTVYGPLEQKLANHEQGLTSQQRFLPFDSLNVKCLLLLNASPYCAEDKVGPEATDGFWNSSKNLV